ncbi:MAG TPA: ChbG/HpnK family deacetylase [Accumulibacter sp.]|nr:ChbG/HpnK family deacetylase [Candidatus Accumulibacter cognatus]MCC2867835.1 ChbG/HpnK family deacetylase [Candidatus Accumulibacter phosphatis]HNF91376.1 ChbG/HpnK family deacetylase [Accumulibacter sp.]HNO13546.1 ChbG/HpnK family deacetylase [Accumulibacter sp.]HNO73462.1 ChbG/HpnK family deacetylase [Accumulibacter sp.]
MPDASSKVKTSLVAAGKRLAICADDFGMSAGINAGILELARLGRLSAVSCLVQGPALSEQVSLLALLPVDIGLHLNFTEAFVRGQFCFSLPRLISACYLQQLPKSLITATIDSQLDGFETRFGRPPDFIDGHQHVHQLPLIREQLLECIAQRYPTRSLWLRSTQTARHLTVDRGKRLKARIIACLGARTMRRLADAQGLPMNRHLLGVYGFSASPEEYRRMLMSWFVDAADGDLLMCHPASAIEAGDPIGQQRIRELSVFADSRFPYWIEQHRLTISRLSRAA